MRERDSSDRSGEAVTAEVVARLEAALELAEQGFSIGQCYGVTPNGRCGCGGTHADDPKAIGKHGGKGWKERATRDPKVIRSRFQTGDPNYMIIPAEGSRLLVIDEDVPGSLDLLGDMPETLIVETGVKPGGARGRHVYGRLPAGISEADLPYEWAGGEVRVGGNGGVVGPFSRHASGITYAPLTPLTVGDLPEPWVANLIHSGRARAADQDTARCADDPGWFITEPGRHPWLTSKAGLLRRGGLGDLALRDALRYLNDQRCRPPKPQDEVDEIASWADQHAGDPGPNRSDKSPRPAIRNVGASVPPEDVEAWLIDRLLRPGALLVVAAPEGVGKSFARKEMAVRLTTCGGSLFGYYPIARSCSVLEIDEENGEAEEFRREERVFAALRVLRSDATGYWSVSHPALDLGDADDRQYLREGVAETRPGVLMLDTGTSMVGEEWGPELKAAIRFLRSLTVEFGCAIVVFVHLTKPPRGKDRTNRMHGSALADVMGQWTRLADAVALMADLGEGRVAWSTFKKVPRVELILVQADGIWTVVQQGAARPLSMDDRVLQAIAAGGGNPDRIAESLGRSSRTVSDAIRRLRDRGLIEPGYPYSLTDAGREVLS